MGSRCRSRKYDSIKSRKKAYFNVGMSQGDNRDPTEQDYWSMREHNINRTMHRALEMDKMYFSFT